MVISSLLERVGLRQAVKPEPCYAGSIKQPEILAMLLSGSDFLMRYEGGNFASSTQEEHDSDTGTTLSVSIEGTEVVVRAIIGSPVSEDRA